MLAFVQITALIFANATVSVRDQNGVPVFGATVVFRDPRGRRDPERTAADGTAHAAAGFEAESADVAVTGFQTVHVELKQAHEFVKLPSLSPVIASVRVATGSAQSLHALPVPASAMDGSDIAASSAVSTDGLLRALPGFDHTRSNSAFTNYGQLRVSFNGMGNDRGVVLLDGFPAQDGFGGQIDWAAIPPQQIDRVEMLRGAGSALYGSGAIGGVLSIAGKGPPAQRAAPNGSLEGVAGNLGLASAALSAQSNGNGNFGWWAGATSQRIAYADLPPAFATPMDREAISDAQTLVVKGRLGDARQALQFSLRRAHDHQDEGRPNYAQDRTRQQFDLRYAGTSGQATASFGFFERGGIVYNDADQFPSLPGVLRYHQIVPVSEDGFDAEWSRAGEHSVIHLRADVRAVRGSSEERNAGDIASRLGSGEQRLGGLSVQEELRGKEADAVFGLRGDVVSSNTRMVGSLSNTVRALSPRIGIRYDISPSVAMRASAGAAFRAPLLNELVRGYAIGNVRYDPNPSLLPERSREIGFGVDILTSTSHASLDFNDGLVRDAIMFSTVDATHRVRSNVGETRARGATVTYSRPAGPCASLHVSASWEDARVVAGPLANLGKRIPYVPDASATVMMQWQTPGLEASVDVSYLGKAYADDRNAQPLDAAVLAGFTLRHTFENGMAVFAKMDNATSSRYLSSNDRLGAPRLLRIGVDLPIGKAERITSSCQVVERSQR